MLRTGRCDNCGALASATGRCRHCGAVTRETELAAAGFGHEDDAFGVTPDVEGARVTRIGRNAIRVEVPPETEIGPTTLSCAGTHGMFVDLDVSVAIRFERAPEGITAGIQLRVGKDGGVCVALSPAGGILLFVQSDEYRKIEVIGRIAASTTRAVNVLRASVKGDLLTVFRDGVAAGSVRCPTTSRGGAILAVDAPLRERGVVVFEDACARLPT